MSVTLPIDKVKEVRNKCVLWKTKTTASKHQLQSIAGKLNHLSKSIKPARHFTNSLLSAVRASPQFGQHNFNKDILVWEICPRLQWSTAPAPCTKTALDNWMWFDTIWSRCFFELSVLCWEVPWSTYFRPKHNASGSTQSGTCSVLPPSSCPIRVLSCSQHW